MTYAVVKEWSDGFQADVVIHNDNMIPVDAWTVLKILGADQGFSYAFNATWSPSRWRHMKFFW